MILKNELYLRAFVPWFLNMLLFWNAVVLPLIILGAKEYPRADFILGYVLTFIPASIVLALMLVCVVTAGEKKTLYELRELAKTGWRFMPYINLPVALYALFYVFGWKRTIRPWLALTWTSFRTPKPH